MDSDLAKVRPLIPANPHVITGNFEEQENSKEAGTPRESPRRPTRAWSGGRGGEGRGDLTYEDGAARVPRHGRRIWEAEAERPREGSRVDAAANEESRRGEAGETSNRSDWQGRR